MSDHSPRLVAPTSRRGSAAAVGVIARLRRRRGPRLILGLAWFAGCGGPPQSAAPPSAGARSPTVEPLPALMLERTTASPGVEIPLAPFEPSAADTAAILPPAGEPVRSPGELGLIAFEARRYPDAARHFAKALQTEPDRIEFLLGLGSSRLHLGEYRLAVPTIEKVLRLDPRQPIAWELLGIAEVERRRFAAALRSLNEAEALGRSTQALYVARCQAQLETGNYEAAIADTRRAEELGSTDPLLFGLRCSAAIRLRDWETAEQALATAIGHQLPQATIEELSAWLKRSRAESP